VLLLSASLVAAWLAPIDAVRVGAQSRTTIVNGHEAAAGEALVRFRTPPRPGDLEREADADRVEPAGSQGARRVHSRSLDAVSLLKVLARRGDVLYAEPNYILRASVTPNDTYTGLLWGLVNTGQTIGGQTGVAGADIAADQAWAITTGSRANVVGVVDTGIDYSHPDLAANVWSAPSSFSVTVGGATIACAAGTHGFNAIARTCNPMDDNNHGTHVSGTIGAQGNNGVGVAGVNWTASIMGLKFLDAVGNGTTADAINAIDFAVQVKQRFGSAANVRVLSNSWGGGSYSQALLDEINAAGANGMLFVAAAGNDGRNNDSTPSYPASYQAANLLAVAATDNRDALASFSNYGATSVELGAPGVYIASTVRSGGYAYMSGTSMATPHVSGAAALTLAACPSLTTAQLGSTLVAAVDPVASLAGKTSTGGRLNVYKALTSCAAPAVPDYTIAVSPASQTVTAGGSATYTVGITRTGGYALDPTLTVSGQPAGASFSPNPLSGTSTLTLGTSASTPAASYPLTVTATDGNKLTRTASATLVVAAPQQADFSLAASPSSVTVRRGASGTVTIAVSRTGGFAEPVSFGVTGLPSGVSATFVPPSTTGGSSTLTLAVANNTRKGVTTITVTGSASVSRTTSVQLQVR
jgi:subtilisin family serine protease